MEGDSKVRCWKTTDPLYIEYHDKEWGVPVHDARARKRGKNKRITKWPTYCVNNILYTLDIISKDEFEVLEKLRKLSNKLRHNQIAMFKMKSSEVDRLLYHTIQVLMRMIELPVPLTTHIDGYKHKFFWKDMGYY